MHEPPAHDLWVFGYGSLMWNPGFGYVERRRARLTGYRRCYCIYSVHYRGTDARPGMVLGLDRGGVCDGIAYRVPAAGALDVLAYLRKREQVTGVYREALLPVELDDASRRHVRALCYLAERTHPGYAGALPLAQQARLLNGARGVSGNCLDYFFATLRHLRELSIREPELERLGVLLGAWANRGTGSTSTRTRALATALARKPVRHRSPQLRPAERRRFQWRKSFGVI